MPNRINGLRKSMAIVSSLFLLLSIIAAAATSVQPAQGANTIYIRADGSIEPQTANITSLDNVTYTFTDNNYDSLVIERDNIVVDGASFTLKALTGHGIDLSSRSNVTIKNMKIERRGRQVSYASGVLLDNSHDNTVFNVSIINNNGEAITLGTSSGNSIHHNSFENGGIELYQTIDNMIYNNTFVNTFIELKGNRDSVYYNNFTEGEINIYGKYNEVYGNIVTKNKMEGIYVGGKFNNVTGNNITECKYGIILVGHHGNILRENKMANNTFNFGLLNEGDIEIYNDVDVSNTVDGKPIYFWNNIKDATVPLDAGVIFLLNCINITIRDLDLRKNLQGILLISSHNSTILNNTITENGYEWQHPNSGGIILLRSSDNVIRENNVTNNNVAGIDLHESWNNTISKNFVAKNEIIGIDVTFSNYTVITENDFLNNLRGIRIAFSAYYNTINRNNIFGPSIYGIELGTTLTNVTDNNIVYCSHGIDIYSKLNKIIGNNIMESYGTGVLLSFAENNTLYHNNFVDNIIHVSVDYYSKGYNNTLDNGYPDGGNYWSGYEEKYPNATEIDSSGIWNTPYTITDANIDNYPLMVPTKPIIRKFIAYSNIRVEIYSNSSISEFQFNVTAKKLSFNVTGPTGTRGFCNVTIPANLLWGDFSIFINGIPLVEGVNYTKTYNDTHYIFFIIYIHSEHTIEIVGTEVIPEFPSAIILPLLLILSIIAAIFAKSARRHKPKPPNPRFSNISLTKETT